MEPNLVSEHVSVQCAGVKRQGEIVRILLENGNSTRKYSRNIWVCSA